VSYRKIRPRCGLFRITSGDCFASSLRQLDAAVAIDRLFAVRQIELRPPRGPFADIACATTLAACAAFVIALRAECSRKGPQRHAEEVHAPRMSRKFSWCERIVSCGWFFAMTTLKNVHVRASPTDLLFGP
jgi:hypothetical protein